jgi:16S rRNA (guanine527-N7)-methyltransferase
LRETSEMKSTKSGVAKFQECLKTKASSYGIALADSALDRLAQYYELLNVWNPRLHLVGPSSPKVFATRHVLESLLLVNYLPENARVADIGSGAGLPIIPCLISRPDISAVLIEASKKKAIFLREALNATAVSSASVIAERFENTEPPEVDLVTSRALERFEQMLPQLISWAPKPGGLLLFGGEGLGRKIAEMDLKTTKNLIPNSEKRYLFVVTNP